MHRSTNKTIVKQASQASQTKAAVRVVIAERQSMVRVALGDALSQSEDIEVVASAANGEDTLRYVHGHRPQVLVVDPGRQAPDKEWLEEIRAVSPQTEIVALVGGSNLRLLRQIMKLGINSIVLKSETPQVLAEAIRDIVAGRAYINPRLGVALARAADEQVLSGREEEILRLIANGYTNQEIAKKVYLSIRTIEAHRANIQKKLDAYSRQAMVAYAVDNGLFP